ncbi:MAG: GNAT family N-acetyltransferase [Thermoprotei archaeon]|nr:GNAT family N-acetyltransferase [Thermoprotei archaeon]
MKIERESFEAEAFEKHVFESILEVFPELFIVVECGGAIAGFVAGIVEGGLCHLVDIAVKPGLRRRGLGERLMEVFEVKCASLGLSRAVLEVKTTNIPAVNLYVKRGFKHVGTIKGYYPDGTDALIMEKELEGGARVGEGEWEAYVGEVL